MRILLIILIYIASQFTCVAQTRNFNRLADAGITLKVGPNNIDSLSVKDFARYKKIVVTPDTGLKVSGFEIIWVPKRGEMVGPFISNNNQFTDKQLDLIKRLLPGNIIYFNNIRIKHPNDSVWVFNFQTVKIIGN